MIPINIFTTVLMAGFLHGIILVIALQRVKKANKRANKFLSLMIGLISLALICRLSYEPQILQISMKLGMLPDFILFLFGPLLLLYIKNLLAKSGELTKINWWHFTPAAIHFLYMLGILLMDRERHLEMILSGQFYLPIHIVLILSLTHNVIYWFACLKVLNAYQKESKNDVSYEPQLKYLYTLLSLTGLCLVVWLISESLTIGGFGRPDFKTYGYVWISLTFIIYALGFFAMNQPELFKVSLSTEKYQNSRLSESKIKDEANRLNDIMLAEQLYKNPKLSRQDLEQETNMNAADLSRVINQGFGKNFFDFVNSYRIEEFTRLVHSGEYQNYTLLAIANEAGFNSKTTFNTAFKKLTGKTPKSFLEETTTKAVAN
ncbi:MAG: helix-turn-helix domain-containing protein [Reichenbachiella sp.]|uniref:helix-turn-helix domain-containing protein n=1 Tax=Reichenbachiella sp. TaxID=2184521 RepID=UPI0032644482